VTGGRGKQRNADLELTARAEVRELRFEKVPETETRFRGDLSQRSSSESRRRNLPDEVQSGVEYSEAGIEWRTSGYIEDSESPDHPPSKRRLEGNT
jgi:hypothetical protein